MSSLQQVVISLENEMHFQIVEKRVYTQACMIILHAGHMFKEMTIRILPDFLQ